MGLSITDLRLELRDHLGMDEDDLDNTAADRLLNRSWWEVMPKFKFRETEAKTSFQTVAGLQTYSLPIDFDALTMLSIGGTSNANLLNGQFYLNGTVFLNPAVSDLSRHTKLERIDDKFYENEFDDAETARGFPIQYYRYGAGIILYPTPDNTYTINVDYRITLADLSTNNPDLVIPQNWHEIILYGAIWRGFQKRGDYNRAREAKQTQFTLINTTTPVAAEEEGDSSEAGLQVARRRR